MHVGGNRGRAREHESHVSAENRLGLGKDQFVPEGVRHAPVLLDSLELGVEGRVEKLLLQPARRLGARNHLVVDAVIQTRHGHKHRRLEFLAVVDDLQSVAAVIPDLCAQEVEDLVHDSLQNMRDRQIGQMHVVLVQVQPGQGQDSRGHRHKLRVRNHRALRQPCCPRSVAERVHVLRLGRGEREHLLGTLQLNFRKREDAEADSGCGGNLVGRRSAKDNQIFQRMRLADVDRLQDRLQGLVCAAQSAQLRLRADEVEGLRTKRVVYRNQSDAVTVRRLLKQRKLNTVLGDETNEPPLLTVLLRRVVNDRTQIQPDQTAAHVLRPAERLGVRKKLVAGPVRLLETNAVTVRVELKTVLKQVKPSLALTVRGSLEFTKGALVTIRSRLAVGSWNSDRLRVNYSTGGVARKAESLSHRRS